MQLDKAYRLQKPTPSELKRETMKPPKRLLQKQNFKRPAIDSSASSILRRKASKPVAHPIAPVHHLKFSMV
ncbi:hypothetical protein TNIN_60361 [Trichonephila inaurata madagascariensis]|uniref:Uncharacterized protein n=1 Tax=Trichonephila inaurata madagascariensis TaxID=2747483 RepID=A0A8X6XJY7_9ARAC|nr:hypothetical protein TNIN_60361 [Trichonephila inaurata madagascariensis]